LLLLRYLLAFIIFHVSCSSDIDFSEEDSDVHILRVAESGGEVEIVISDIKGEYIVATDGPILGKIEAAIGPNTFPRANNLYITAVEDLSSEFVYPEDRFDSNILGVAQSIEITASKNDSLAKNIVVSIPLPEPLAIISPHLVVLYQYSLNGKEYYGLFSCEDYELSANLVSVSVGFLGSYQAVYLDSSTESLIPVSEGD
jgi:hypothetical protein